MRTSAHVPTYRSWQMMKNRCLNPNAMDYAYYGGRGISIDPNWNEYDLFVHDMGERPHGMTLERNDPTGNYCKENCCWADRLTQARNREYTLDVEFGGRSQKVWEWAKELKLKQASFHLRLWRARKGKIAFADVFKPNLRAK